MKKATTVVILFGLLASVFPVLAQQTDGTIEYGQTVSGEITNENFEIPYTFTGSQGDVIIIEMKAVDPLGDLDSPSVILLDSNFSVIGASDTFGNVVFAAKLPADGKYTILATRRDGRAGDSTGAYTLTLLLPPLLNVNESVEGTVTNESASYYVFETAEPFFALYQKTAGNFAPEFAINVIGEDNALNAVAALNGAEVWSGRIGIQPQSATIQTSYILTLKEALFDFNFDTVSADYTLTITLPE